MLKDAYGNEIRLGDTVRHRFPVLDLDMATNHPDYEPRGCHFFAGSGVATVTDKHVAHVNYPHGPGIPVHLGEMLVVEKGVDGRALATE